MNTNLTVFLVITMLVAGCASAPTEPEKTPLELQSIQAKEFETGKRAAFSATMSVFQDLGFIIDDGDFETGLITATGPTSDEKGDMPGIFEILFSTPSIVVTRHRRATAFVEEMPSGTVRVRLNFVFVVKQSNGGGSHRTDPIHEPELYQTTFDKIDQAIFVRTATE